MKFPPAHLIIIALLWTLFCGAVATTAEVEDRKKLIEMAQKEGNLVFYTSWMPAMPAR